MNAALEIIKQHQIAYTVILPALCMLYTYIILFRYSLKDELMSVNGVVEYLKNKHVVEFGT